MTQAYPLSWPLRQPRTPAGRRETKRGAESLKLHRARVLLEQEVRRLAGRNLVMSSNLLLRLDGLPRSGQPVPEDPGVAVYFRRRDVDLVFACDRWRTPEQNLRAIVQHIEALRGMERWGVGTLDQAFTGYRALPETASTEAWWSVLGLGEIPTSVEVLRVAYRKAARAAHPDKGGTDATMARVNAAYRQGLDHFGGGAS